MMPEESFEITIRGKSEKPATVKSMAEQFVRRLNQASGGTVQEATVRQQGATISVKEAAEEQG